MVEEVVERAARLKVQPDLVGLLNTQRTYYQRGRMTSRVAGGPRSYGRNSVAPTREVSTTPPATVL